MHNTLYSMLHIQIIYWGADLNCSNILTSGYVHIFRATVNMSEIIINHFCLVLYQFHHITTYWGRGGGGGGACRPFIPPPVCDGGLRAKKRGTKLYLKPTTIQPIKEWLTSIFGCSSLAGIRLGTWSPILRRWEVIAKLKAVLPALCINKTREDIIWMP